MNCKPIGKGRPRIIPGRHENCTDPDLCAGCEPCPEPHCRVCSHTHAPNTCAECVATTRDNLHTIAKLCGALPTEVKHRGINGEAMMLLGPAANPEAWGYRALSAMMGRLDDSYLEDCRDEQHPLWVLGYWSEKWRIHLQHHTDLDLTLERAVDYLDQQMTYMAGVEEVPFEDMAADLRGCRSRLDAVLHDQNQGDRANVGCFTCGGDLERRLTQRRKGPTPSQDTGGFEDHWTCSRCRQTYTQAEYNFALRAKLEEAS